MCQTDTISSYAQNAQYQHDPVRGYVTAMALSMKLAYIATQHDTQNDEVVLRHTAKQPGSERLGDTTGLGHTERLKGQAPDRLQTKQTTGLKQRLLGSPYLRRAPR